MKCVEEWMNKMDNYHFLLMGVIIGWIMFFSLSSIQDSRGSTGGIVSDFDVSNLRGEDKLIAINLFNEIKREYLIGNKIIIFKYNITEEAKKIDESELSHYYPNLVGGLNERRPMWMGSVTYIKFVENQTHVRESICHELLHNFMELNRFAHSIVEDIDDYDVCFIEEQEREQ